jgi:ubiquitin C-terminal hydrolase
MHKELNNFDMNSINFNEMNNPMKDQRNEKGEYKIFIEDYYSSNSSIIQKLFYGEQESISVCHNCNVKMYNFNVFSFLIFPLEKVRQYMINIRTRNF